MLAPAWDDAPFAFTRLLFVALAANVRARTRTATSASCAAPRYEAPQSWTGFGHMYSSATLRRWIAQTYGDDADDAAARAAAPCASANFLRARRTR